MPNLQQSQYNTNYSAAASLVAVLSDELEPQQQSSSFIPNEAQIEQNSVGIKAKKEKSKPKAEPIKLKIKTNARLRNNDDLVEQSEEPEPYKGRSTRRNTPQHINVPNEDNVPVPGTPNYELYRTLTESPTNKQQCDPTQSHFAVTSDPRHQPFSPEYQHCNSLQVNPNIPFQQNYEADAVNSNTNSDTERGILPKKRRGRNKAKFEENTEIVPEEPVQKNKRGRRKNDEQPEVTEDIASNNFANVEPEHQSPFEEANENFPKKRITAAAKKQYKDENLFLVEQPKPSPTPVENPIPNEDISEPIGNRRGRKAKGKPNQNTTNTEEMSQPEIPQRPTRATRHTANGNMTRVNTTSNLNILVIFSNISDIL